MNRQASPRPGRRPGLLSILASLLLPAGSALAGEPATTELFPQAFRVEHQVIDRERDGTVFYGEPVRDTYGGSWIVSERPDGSRLVIDLARRELTEMRPADGVYWTIGFSRFAELRGRIARLEGDRRPAAEDAVGAKAAAGAPEAPAPPAELEVVELSGVAARGLAAGSLAAGSLAEGGRTEPLPAALAAPEIRKLAVRARGAADPAAEVWVDPRLKLSAAAQAALGAFEDDALGNALGATSGAAIPGALDPARVMAAVRRATAGALPVLTVLPVLRDGGEQVGESEDRVLAASRLEAFPAELARVPEGLVRTSHPLESILAALEAQARIDDALAGRGGAP